MHKTLFDCLLQRLMQYAAMGENSIESRDYMASLGKGLAIIELFNEERRQLSVTEVAELCALTRASARRCLLTLAHLGYLAFDGKSFSLTPRVMRLGHAYLAATPLPKLLQPYLDRLASNAGEPSIAGILDGMNVVCVAQATPSRLAFMSLTVGSQLDAYNTAIGRVLLAHAEEDWLNHYWTQVRPTARTKNSLVTRDALSDELAKVRRDGYSVIDEEVEMGLRTIAVPLRNSNGRVVAGLNLIAHGNRLSAEDMPDALLPFLRQVQEDFIRLS